MDQDTEESWQFVEDEAEDFESLFDDVVEMAAPDGTNEVCAV